ncbi:heme exporter protein CcmD [Dyella psychrodurans]|uniref:Heme exporter protein D n=1 Tax=Dyella psychrodurans TaxID=1927960 RepID=A0A370XDQ9_9GAMM|nr:heme exporter protein CcmD [Dyella psychrodurans]RDS86563.1 heme exporter protein CcmD [Dyella psychrodurans]
MSAGSLQSFFAMGGYAAYVWPAYGVFFIVLLIDWLAPQLRRRRLLRELRERMARQDARKERANRNSATAT